MTCEEVCKCGKAAKKEIVRKGSIQKNARYTSGADALVDALNEKSNETNREAKAQSTPKGKPKARRAVPGQESRELTLPELGLQYLETGKTVEIFCHRRSLFETVSIGRPRGGEWPISTTFEAPTFVTTGCPSLAVCI